MSVGSFFRPSILNNNMQNLLSCSVEVKVFPDKNYERKLLTGSVALWISRPRIYRLDWFVLHSAQAIICEADLIIGGKHGCCALMPVPDSNRCWRTSHGLTSRFPFLITHIQSHILDFLCHLSEMVEPVWCNGRAKNSGSRGPRFETRLCHMNFSLRQEN